ncbi:MAG: hypothetical protein IPG70_02290, partial [Moraxellaceae bacterium]|nr:hypothetical protein [Moraxellaceae bacterium]
RTHLPLKIKFAHDTVFTGAYHDPHTYPRHMATTPSRMAAKPTQQKRLLQKHNLKLITFYKWASKLSAKTTPTSLEQPPVSASNTALTLIPLTRHKPTPATNNPDSPTHINLYSPQGWRIECPIHLNNDALPHIRQLMSLLP